VGFDGHIIWFTSLAMLSYTYSINILDNAKVTTSYPWRLYKYFVRGFSIVLPYLNMDNITGKKKLSLILGALRFEIKSIDKCVIHRKNVLSNCNILNWLYSNPGIIKNITNKSVIKLCPLDRRDIRKCVYSPIRVSQFAHHDRLNLFIGLLSRSCEYGVINLRFMTSEKILESILLNYPSQTQRYPVVPSAYFHYYRFMMNIIPSLTKIKEEELASFDECHVKRKYNALEQHATKIVEEFMKQAGRVIYDYESILQNVTWYKSNNLQPVEIGFFSIKLPLWSLYTMSGYKNSSDDFVQV
jgi:hypothetical protein